MIQRAFQHRSGRVVSLSRFLLALSFLAALWIDPNQPARHEPAAYLLLALYAAASAALLGATWSDWWRDRRLAEPAAIADLAVFAAAVYFTQAYTSGFTSPIFTFFAFLIFSASLRRGWREAALTALAGLALYVGVGLLGARIEPAPDLDLYRFGRRAAYLLILALVLIWFGVHQRRPPGENDEGEIEVSSEGRDPPVAAALAYAARRTGAARVLLVWWQKEEPWMRVAERGPDGEVRQQRFGPAELGAVVSGPMGEQPFLFDLPRRRALAARPATAASHPQRLQPLETGFAARFGIERGLAVPVRANDYEGELFLLDVPGLATDDLGGGEAIGRELARAFDRFTMVAMAEEAAVSRTRLAIARDLHDSIGQVLAGASFRLEALRSWIRSGEDPDPEIAAIKEGLRAEQRHIRALIARLRLGGEGTGPTDLAESLARLAAELSRQWGVDIRLAPGSAAPLPGPAWLAHELQQLLREAAANAVRHGGAGAVSVELGEREGALRIAVGDDGAGFPVEGGGEARELEDWEVRPWSIHERVMALGGTLSLRSGKDGSRLDISLPLEREE